MSNDYFWSQYNSTSPSHTVQPITKTQPINDKKQLHDEKIMRTMEQRVAYLEQTARKLSIDNNNLEKELKDLKRKVTEMETAIKDTLMYLRSY